VKPRYAGTRCILLHSIIDLLSIINSLKKYVISSETSKYLKKQVKNS
jgi:hypothetical protein